MHINNIEDMRAQINEWIQLDYILPEDIPAIELYMDQITTFMDKELCNNKRNEEDKILTKTMINNYTKNDLIPPPDKKKYSKNHIIVLIYIYYLKNFISIGDIQKLLAPMIDDYFEVDSKSTPNLSSIYNDIFDLESKHRTDVLKNLFQSKKLADSKFDPDTDEYLNDLAFILVMSYDIYLKKQIIERMIDNMKLPEDDKDKKDDKKESKEKKKKVIVSEAPKRPAE